MQTKCVSTIPKGMGPNLKLSFTYDLRQAVQNCPREIVASKLLSRDDILSTLRY